MQRVWGGGKEQGLGWHSNGIRCSGWLSNTCMQRELYSWVESGEGGMGGLGDEQKAHLNHEVLDAPVKDGVGIVSALRQDEEVLAGAGRQIAVQLQVKVSQVGV